jgi:hypothetical protein
MTYELEFDFDTEQAQILSEEEQGILRLESVPSDMGTQDENAGRK